jgi:hypothetical protein
MSSKALKKLICACSLLLAAAVSPGSELSEFRAAVDAADTLEELRGVMRGAPERVVSDPSIKYYFDSLLNEFTVEGDWHFIKTEIIETVDGKLAFEQAGATGKVKDPARTAKQILDSPIYIDRQEREGRNWLDDAATRIGERLLAWLRKLMPDRGPSIGNLPSMSFSGLTTVAWFLLGAVVLLIVYFVLRNFKGVGRRRRRVGGILEDDEPERTADQWLAQADKLEAEGRYREAVRCLYIACLVRYDDGRVARFRRHETNWEHLHRITASALNPRQVDFRSATQKFDKVWYGYMVKGPEDVGEFREVYKRLCEALQIKIAA